MSYTDGSGYVDGPLPIHVGETLYFQITVANTGGSDLDVDFSDPNCDAGTLTGPTGDGGDAGVLDAGETWTFRCSHVVTAADLTNGSFQNTACAEGTSDSGGSDDDCDSAGGNVLDPRINVVKDGPATAYHGDQVTYTFTVTNTGNTAARRCDGERRQVRRGDARLQEQRRRRRPARESRDQRNFFGGLGVQVHDDHPRARRRRGEPAGQHGDGLRHRRARDQPSPTPTSTRPRCCTRRSTSRRTAPPRRRPAMTSGTR